MSRSHLDHLIIQVIRASEAGDQARVRELESKIGRLSVAFYLRRQSQHEKTSPPEVKAEQP